MSLSRDALITRCQNYANDFTNRVDTTDWTLYLNDWLRRAATDYNLPWAKRRTQLLVYADVFEYPVPSDFRDLVEPQLPIDEDTRNDAWFLFQTQKSFARNRNGRNDTSVDWERGTRYFLIDYSAGVTNSGVTLHDMDDDDANGLWSVGGVGASLAVDDGIFRVGSASLRFTASSAGTITLTNSTFSAVDITDHPTQARVFLWFYQSETGVTSLTIRVGSDASNYYESAAVTTAHNGSAFIAGWQLVSFAYPTTATGDPDETATDYIRLSIAGAVANATYRVDNIVSRLWTEFDLHYYSTNVVLDDDGTTYKELLADANDQIIGPTEFEDCAVFHAVAMAAKYKLHNADMEARATGDFTQRFTALKIKYPNLAPKQSIIYYDDSLLD